jgi:hypothetical protein
MVFLSDPEAGGEVESLSNLQYSMRMQVESIEAIDVLGCKKMPLVFGRTPALDS